MNKKLLSFIFTFVLVFTGLFAGSFTNVANAAVPNITSISPAEGKVGDIVTINGENFTGVNKVLFGSIPVADLDVHPVSLTKLTVTVPVGAIDGKITVKTQKYGDAISGVVFKILNNTAGTSTNNKITLVAKNITETSVTLEASGVLLKNSYDFYLYDRATYNNPPLKTFKAIISKIVDVKNSTDGSIEVKFDNLKLQQGEFYVGIVSYNGDNNIYPFFEFKVPNNFSSGLENIKIENLIGTSVDLVVDGLLADTTYEIYLEDITKGTPPIKKPLNPLVTEEETVLPEKVSFTGLIPNDNYVAYLIKNNDMATFLGRVYFTAKAGSTGTGTITDTSDSDVKDCGIVPCCNTGAIDTVTGQYKIPCDFNYFMKLINNIIKFLLFTIATPLIALIIMYTGYLYITAGGKTGQTEKVRHILFNAVIGYVIALAAWLIVNTILTSLNIDPTIETFLK